MVPTHKQSLLYHILGAQGWGGGVLGFWSWVPQRWKPKIPLRGAVLGFWSWIQKWWTPKVPYLCHQQVLWRTLYGSPSIASGTITIMSFQIAADYMTQGTGRVEFTTSHHSTLTVLFPCTVTWTPRPVAGWSSWDAPMVVSTTTAAGKPTARASGKSPRSSGLGTTTFSWYQTRVITSFGWICMTFTGAGFTRSTKRLRLTGRGIITGCTSATTRAPPPMDSAATMGWSSAPRTGTTITGRTTTAPGNGRPAGGLTTAGLYFSPDHITTLLTSNTVASHGMTGNKSSWNTLKWRFDHTPEETDRKVPKKTYESYNTIDVHTAIDWLPNFILPLLFEFKNSWCWRQKGEGNRI